LLAALFDGAHARTRALLSADSTYGRDDERTECRYPHSSPLIVSQGANASQEETCSKADTNTTMIRPMNLKKTVSLIAAPTNLSIDLNKALQ
jgi:hypothetical protein